MTRIQCGYSGSACQSLEETKEHRRGC